MVNSQKSFNWRERLPKSVAWQLKPNILTRTELVYNKLPLESLTEPLDAAIEELLAEMGESVELVGIEHEAVDATAMADD